LRFAVDRRFVVFFFVDLRFAVERRFAVLRFAVVRRFAVLRLRAAICFYGYLYVCLLCGTTTPYNLLFLL